MVRSTCSVALFSFPVMPDSPKPPSSSCCLFLPFTPDNRGSCSADLCGTKWFWLFHKLSPVSERFLPFYFFILIFSEYRTGSPLAAVLFVCARQTATFVRKKKIVVYFDTRGVVYFCNEPTEDWIISLPPLTAPIGSDRAALDVQYLCNCT